MGKATRARMLPAALLLALVAVACGPVAVPTPSPPASSPVAVSPTPTATESPSAAPTETASPTASPTATPTPTPRPPTTVELIVEFWRTIRLKYPWLPEVLPQPGAIGAPAYFGGIKDGVAIFPYQEGAVLGAEGGVVWHEAGHCALDAASRLSGVGTDELMTAYWTARGFPGTWQQQQAKADLARAQGVTGYALHQMLPNEMFADTFASTNVPGWPDGDAFPGVPLDRPKMRAFYTTLPYLMKAPVTTSALGPLHGERAFVTRVERPRLDQGASHPGIGEVWAVDRSDGTAKRAAIFVTSLDDVLPDTNEPARALSPDGKRLVLSVGVRDGDGWRYVLAVVNLETGVVTTITNDARYHDLSPAWSPDGTRIAFARRFNQAVRYDSGLWMVNPDGTGLRQLLETLPQGATVLYGWSADGTSFGYDMVDRGGGYALFDLARNTQSIRYPGYVDPVHPAAWRAAEPALALATGPQPGAPTTIAVADGAALPLRVVAGPDDGFVLSRPAWHPASADILYLRTLFDLTELYRVNATDGKPASRIPTSVTPTLAAWTTAGDGVVFVANGSALGSASIRIVGADGTQEREIAQLPQPVATWQASFRDLAVLGYR